MRLMELTGILHALTAQQLMRLFLLPQTGKKRVRLNLPAVPL
jgi:hypothetical protein